MRARHAAASLWLSAAASIAADIQKRETSGGKPHDRFSFPAEIGLAKMYLDV